MLYFNRTVLHEILKIPSVVRHAPCVKDTLFAAVRNSTGLYNLSEKTAGSDSCQIK